MMDLIYICTDSCFSKKNKMKGSNNDDDIIDASVVGILKVV
jgi:hypothetical protein